MPCSTPGDWDVGLQYPAALGVEGSGSVLAVGAGVTDIRVGDEVLAHEAPFPKGSGFWAERALITAEHVAKRPEGLDPVTAGGLPIAGLTAQQVIDELGIGPGFRLLITGGAGTSGTVVVQLAAAAGAQVTATASEYHTDRLTALGADTVVDYHRLDWSSAVGGPFNAALIAAPGTGAAASQWCVNVVCYLLSPAMPPRPSAESGPATFTSNRTGHSWRRWPNSLRQAL
jgi:NADPH:quinone reductase-like Zn-dependent oxidoreductase